MIKFEQVSKTYPGGHRALEKVTFQLANNELAFLTGHSGAGKSTLLKLISVMERPSAGHVYINGSDLNAINNRQIPFIRRDIGIIFQKPHFVNSLTVGENLELAQFLGRNKRGDIKLTLESLKILDKINKKPKELSHGEKQRVSIAIAIINSPKLILADEPTSSLDDTNCANVINILKEQALKHAAQLVVITHDSRLKKHFKNSLEL